MNVVDYRRFFEKFFEGTIDILSWEEFEEFMEKRRIIGEEDISDKLKGFPLLGMLGCDDGGRHLVKVKEPIELTSSESFPSKALLKFIKKHGPYMYGDWVELLFPNTKLEIGFRFAGRELKVITNIMVGKITPGFKVNVLAEKVENNRALRTNDGVLFQRTPVGVILYDRHEHYLNSIDGIYAYYS